MRVVGLCVLTYAMGEQLTALLLPALLLTWLVTRVAISCCFSCGGGGGYGYRDVVSLFEGGLRDLKRLLTPSFMDTALTARRLSIDFLLTSLVCGVGVYVGLQEWMPHPHVDPEFRANALLLTIHRRMPRMIPHLTSSGVAEGIRSSLSIGLQIFANLKLKD